MVFCGRPHSTDESINWWDFHVEKVYNIKKHMYQGYVNAVYMLACACICMTGSQAAACVFFCKRCLD